MVMLGACAACASASDQVALFRCLEAARNGTIARRVTMDATIYLLILVVAFIGIVIWVFGRKRKARFEADARIPFHDDKGSQS